MDIDSLNMSKHHYNCAITVQLSLSFHSRTKLKKTKKRHTVIQEQQMIKIEMITDDTPRTMKYEANLLGIIRLDSHLEV